MIYNTYNKISIYCNCIYVNDMNEYKLSFEREFLFIFDIYFRGLGNGLKAESLRVEMLNRLMDTAATTITVTSNCITTSTNVITTNQLLLNEI